MQDATEVVIKRYQCRHIFTDGRRCGSPCLREAEFCYYHHNTRRPAGNSRARRASQAEFDLGMPEDRSAIQCTIGEVLHRIARNEIDPKRAGLLLYGLQIASLNLARQAEPARDKELIEEVTADPELGTLAPTAEIAKTAARKSFAQTLIEEFRAEQEANKQAAAAQAAAKAARSTEDPAAKPAILPLIQACRQKRRPRQPSRATKPSKANAGPSSAYPIAARRGPTAPPQDDKRLSAIRANAAVRLWFPSLTIVVQRSSVKSEVVSTLPSFRFPELSQPI